MSSLYYKISQKSGTQDVEIELEAVDMSVKEFRVGYIGSNNAEFYFDPTQNVNPSWNWIVSSVESCQSSGSTKGKITIKDLTVGDKILFMQAVPCDPTATNYAERNKMAKFEVKYWWQNTSNILVMTMLAVLLYLLFITAGFIGAYRLQISNEMNDQRKVASWISFGLGVFVPVLQVVPVALGFTAEV